ncbi:MAG: phosphatidate cytidylyltransferase [Phycisphaerae bacterium]|nr:phosphatidate cytidylyltransferase [Phycisphaerae bacterium]
MRRRLLLGPVLIAALIGLLWLDEFVDLLGSPGWLATLTGEATCPAGLAILPIVVFLSMLGAAELAAIIRAKGVAASTPWTVAAAMVGLAAWGVAGTAASTMTSAAFAFSSVVGVLVGSMVFYARHKSSEGVTAAASGSLLSFAYLGVMPGFILALRAEHSAWVLLWVLLTIKACDTGAYFTGKAIGRHKLIPWLSPGKTWEGLGGGVVWSVVSGGLGAWLLVRAGIAAPGVGAGLVAGAVFALLGQGGDLLESMLKRDAGIKDSGASLPGFGGVLDIIDSPILVVPVAFWWLRMVG